MASMIRKYLPILILLFLPLLVEGSSFRQLIVMGDSFSDTYNLHKLSKKKELPYPYFNGRASNGPLWIEVFASLVGLPKPLASSQGGLNFATGGATSGFGYRNIISKNIGTQIQDCLDRLNNKIPPDTLVVLLAAGNDFQTEDWFSYLLNMETHIRTLHQAGAKHFFISNLPPLGYFPLDDKFVLGKLQLQLEDDYFEDFFHEALRALKPSTAKVLNKALKTFYNKPLKFILKLLKEELDIEIYFLDTFRIITDMYKNPADYGITHVRTPAYDIKTGHIHPEAQTHLFWDPIHITAHAHSHLGQAAASLFKK